MSDTVTKKTIARKVAESNDTTYRLGDKVVDTIFDEIAKQAGAGKTVSINNFGKFAVKVRPPRTGRNPKTGDAIPVPAKNLMKFKVSSVLKGKLQESFDAA